MLINHSGIERSPPELYHPWKTQPNYDGEYDKVYNFEQLSIKYGPLSGLVSKDYACKVHQMIHIFLKGYIYETWTKPRRSKQYGKVRFKTGGKGNKYLRITEAEVLKKTSLE